jgi:phosphoglycolate phosphatase
MNKIDARLIIFDLDGTLIDSKRDIAYAVNEMLKRMDLRPIEPGKIYGYVGNGVRPLIEQTLAQNGMSADIPTAIDHFRELYIKHLLDTTVMFDGVKEVLDHFQKSKIMAVASNKPIRYVKKIVDGLGMTGYFTAIKGGDDVEMKKPAPEMLNAIMEETSIGRESCVFVGDSGVDIRTGKNAGVKTVGVTYGFRPVEEIVENEPDLLVDSPLQLKEIIR